MPTQQLKSGKSAGNGYTATLSARQKCAGSLTPQAFTGASPTPEALSGVLADQPLTAVFSGEPIPASQAVVEVSAKNCN